MAERNSGWDDFPDATDTWAGFHDAAPSPAPAKRKRLFGNPKIRVVPRPKKDDSAEVYIGEEFIGVLFVDDEDDDRSYQFQMAILEEDLDEVN